MAIRVEWDGYFGRICMRDRSARGGEWLKVEVEKRE